MAFRLTARARRDLNRILKYSVRYYGHDAADRYELLLLTVMEEVSETPHLHGSRNVMRRPGVRDYAIARSRLHVPKDQRVQRPAHSVVYRTGPDGVVEILAVVGDSYPSARVRAPRQ